MSRPDYIMICEGDYIPPEIPGFHHRLGILPAGMTLTELGDPEHRGCGIFAVDPDCANVALNDPSFDWYLRHKMPILIYAARPRDLRRFLKRSDSFRARGFVLEAIA